MVVVLVDGDPVRASACKFKAGMDGLAAAALSKMVIPDGWGVAPTFPVAPNVPRKMVIPDGWSSPNVPRNSGEMGMNCEERWGDGGEEAASKLNRLMRGEKKKKGKRRPSDFQMG